MGWVSHRASIIGVFVTSLAIAGLILMHGLEAPAAALGAHEGHDPVASHEALGLCLFVLAGVAISLGIATRPAAVRIRSNPPLVLAPLSLALLPSGRSLLIGIRVLRL